MTAKACPSCGEPWRSQNPWTCGPCGAFVVAPVDAPSPPPAAPDVEALERDAVSAIDAAMVQGAYDCWDEPSGRALIARLEQAFAELRAARLRINVLETDAATVDKQLGDAIEARGTADAELRAARETIRALEGIAEAADVVVKSESRMWGEALATVDGLAIATLRARLAERK